MATTIKSTALDFTAIKNNLKTFLADKDEFADYNFEASGLSNILDVLAYNTHYNASILRDNIIDNIEAYEPRAEVLDVVVDLYPDNHVLNVTVKFKVVNTEEQVEFTTRLSRLR